MKTILSSVLVVLTVFALCGCKAEPKQVSGTEFTAMLKRNPESMRSTHFIGIENGMAIMKVSEMSLVNKSKWRDTYFATPVDNLVNP